MTRSGRCGLLLALFVLPFSQAEAVSDRVRRACNQDYMTFCSAHEVGSEGLRQCMRKADKKLSRACVDALVEAGEISAAEVQRRRAASH
jgi:adenylate kinase